MTDRHDPTDDEERRHRELEEHERERADRNPATWWEEDHLAGSNGKDLKRAVDDLVQGCGCAVGTLLDDLREIEDLSDGYDFYLPDRRTLPRFIERLRAVAHAASAIEQSPLGHQIPVDVRIDPDHVLRYADALEEARRRTQRSPRPARARRIRDLIAYVDGRTPERGQLGKARADAALALLLSAVTHRAWTVGALRMERSRINQARGRKRTQKIRKPTVRRLRGSGAKGRKSKLVPLYDNLAPVEHRGQEGDQDPSE